MTQMNRSDLTKRLVAKLAHDEAVVGGIGNTNFDLYMAGHRPQNFYMLGSMGLACPIALGVALAQPERGVIALEGDGSILMTLGCLTTIAMLHPRNLTVIIMDNGMLSDHRRPADRDQGPCRHRRDRARSGPRKQLCGRATKRISSNCSRAASRKAGLV